MRLEILLWRALGIVDRQTNSEDRARIHSAMLRAAEMTSGKKPHADKDCKNEWEDFVGGSGLMLGQALPDVIHQITALQPSCSATKNFIEMSAVQSPVENGVFMSIVSLKTLEKSFKNYQVWGNSF